MPTSREIRLIKRPEGELTEGDFAMVETQVPEPADGQVLVRNLYMSVDPAMRPRMSAGQALNEAMGGGALGRVETSRNLAFAEGDAGHQPLRLSRVVRLGRQGPANAQNRARPFAHRPHARPGHDRLHRLRRAPAHRPAEGRRTGVRLHRRRGGGLDRRPDRQDQGLLRGRLDRLRREGALADARRPGWTRRSTTRRPRSASNWKTATPKGIDVYFDNVGGDHLDAALAGMNPLGRVAGLRHDLGL